LPRITEARTVPEVVALRDVWMAANPAVLDAHPDYFLSYVEHAGNVVRPHVVHIELDDRSLVVVSRLEELALPLRLGYRTIGRLRVRALVVAFDGVVGATSADDVASAAHVLQKALDSGEADLLLFPKAGVAASRAVSGIVPWWRRVPGRPTVVRRTGPTTGLGDVVSGSPKHRARMRREARRLEEAFEDVEVRREGDYAGPDALLDDLAAVEAHSYQSALGVTVADELHRALARTCWEHRWLRAWVLRLDGRPVAFWQGTAYDGQFAVGTPGFDPALADLSVGRYTMLAMLRDLHVDPDIRAVDFGHGEAEYKAAVAPHRRLEQDVMILAQRPWPICVGLLVLGTTAVNSTGKRLALRLGRLTTLRARGRAGAAHRARSSSVRG